MGKGPKIPGKTRSSKPEGGSLSSQLTNPTVLAGIVVAILLVGVALAFIGDDAQITSELRDFDNLLKRVGCRRKKVEIVCNATSREHVGGCYLAARAPLFRGEVAIKVPKELIIDVRTIMESPEYRDVLGREENGTMDATIKENNLEQSYYYYIFAYYLAAEKSKGSKSEIAEWLAVLPTEEQMNTGLQWDPNDDECLDEATRQEVQYFRNVLQGMGKIHELVCQQTKCIEMSFEDQRWGMSIYRSRSLQDQAIVIPLDFANHAQDRQNIMPEWNAEEKLLDIKMATNVNKGEELFVHYGFGKSPMSLLVSHGFVEDGITNFFPAAVMMDTDKIPLLKRYGCEKKWEVGYGSSGKPKQTFVNCLTVLVATEEQRARWKGIYKNESSFEWAEIMYYTYGNITYGIEVTAQKSTPAHEAKCADRNTAALQMVTKMQHVTMQFLVKAHQYNGEMRQKMAAKYVKMGGVIPSPSEQQQQQQGGAQDAASTEASSEEEGKP